MSKEQVPERVKRWADMMDTVHTTPAPRHATDVSVRLTDEERRQLYVCTKYASDKGYFVGGLPSLRRTLVRLKDGGPMSCGQLLIAGFGGDIGLYLHIIACEMVRQPFDGPFSLCEDEGDLSSQVITPVCDRIYAALGGGIRLGHHRMTKGGGV